MKTVGKILKWTGIIIVVLIILGIAYLRFSRITDPMFGGQMDGKYAVLKTDLTYEEISLQLPYDDKVTIHGVLFKPDSIPMIATVYHH